MRLGFQNKILPILLSLSLILNLILIPGIHSQAATYSAETSFTYNFDGYNYQFYYSGLTDVPDDYRFDSSALDYLLQKSAEGINISISAGIGAKISGLLSSGLSSIFNLYRNFVITTDKIVADWIVWDDIYGFEFQFTGVDSSYPGNETYGAAYGWSFIGWLGEKIDLVLDSQGMLYGSNPIGNYTFSDDQLDIGRWSIHQYEAQGGEFWSPSNYVSSFNNLPTPYIVGKSLYFTVYVNNVEHNYIVEDFRNINIGLVTNNAGMLGFLFYSAIGQDLNTSTFRVTDNGSPISLYSISVSFSDWRSLSPSKTTVNALFTDNLRDYSFNLPGYTTGGFTFYKNNVKGFYQNSPVSGFADIFLYSFSASPLPNPIVLPVDDPIPVSDIQPDPIDFTPDPDDDPDPVPGIDYPVDPPLPWPVPPVPPIVSGNDDLWPELNITFDLEDGLIDLANPLVNFEWPSFSSVISSFLDSIVWVSTIMTALYSGTDFNVLFAVLSVFFIAASLLGLYKWWHK